MTHGEAINFITTAKGISQGDLGVMCGYTGKNPAASISPRLKNDVQISKLRAMANALGYEVVLQPIPADPKSRAANQLVLDGISDATIPKPKAGRKPSPADEENAEPNALPEKTAKNKKAPAEKQEQEETNPAEESEEQAKPRPSFITPDGKFILTPVDAEQELKAQPRKPEVPAGEEDATVSAVAPNEVKSMADEDWNTFLRHYAGEE